MANTKLNRFKTAQKEIKLIIQRLKAEYKPEKVILFGSLAHRKITDSSDIDLLIIKKTPKNHWTRLREVDQYFDHNFPVDFLVYTPEEIRNRLKLGDVFIEDIMKEGKIIYEK